MPEKHGDNRHHEDGDINMYKGFYGRFYDYTPKYFERNNSTRVS